MGGVWRWILFSHGFQFAFTFKTVVKALDRDLLFVQCYIWGNTPTFCAHVIVSNLLCSGPQHQQQLVEMKTQFKGEQLVQFNNNAGFSFKASESSSQRLLVCFDWL